MISIPEDILKRYWGYSSFRPLQREIVQSAINGIDTLALLPTGGGKSICFQVPALCMEGICLVISPLMALMYDQVNNLKSRGIKAEAITSAMGKREIDRILDNCIYNDVKFLYVSPERLQNELFLVRLQKMNVCLIAVDEAHCISQWGYDFRPDYLQIAALRELKKGVPFLALTASATPTVVADIQEKLLFAEKHVIANSFKRENLIYVVRETEDKENKLLEILKQVPGVGIVYCGTRKRTKEVAEMLIKRGIKANYYHAGLSHELREKAFQQWMKEEVRVICATNAFGMGIDKPNVRLVVHADVSANIESYFQEAGRAGRDGQKAYAALLFRQSDIELLTENLEKKYQPMEFIRNVYKHVYNEFQIAIGAGQETRFPFTPTEMAAKYKLPVAETMYALRFLELAGYFVISESAFAPSKLFFTVSKQQLYSFQVANPAMDPFIKMVLRIYGGVFDNYITIRESDIARALKCSVKEVMTRLSSLQKLGIVDYEPQTDQPKITFLKPRFHEQEVRLPKEIYEDRKRTDFERLHSMKRYLQLDRCRSIQLLEYFGEKNVEACGKCDVCQAHKQAGLAAQTFERMSEDLHEIVLKQSVTLDELPSILSQYNREELIQLVRWKLDHNELALDDGLRIVLPGLE